MGGRVCLCARAYGAAHANQPDSLMKHLFRNVLLLLLLAAAGFGAVSLWNYAEELAQPILVPTNPSYRGFSTLPKKAAGLKLEPFTFQGYDGAPVQAVLAERGGEESSRQLSVLGHLAAEPVMRLQAIDYVLVCVDWDHGILSALPLAESLTAAGLKCVLWEPRGSNSRRPYTTHGLREHEDVAPLLDAVRAMSDKPDPVIVGVGQGFGASLLMQATATEPRISGLVSIDAYASLRHSVQRSMPESPLAPLTLLLMDFKISQTVGVESFDVAPVESASAINRDVPVLVLNLVQDSPICNLDDAVTIFRRLPCEHKEIRTLRSEEDAVENDTRSVTRSEGSDEKARKVHVDVALSQDEDSALVDVIRWLDTCVVDAVLAPRISAMPTRMAAGVAP